MTKHVKLSFILCLVTSIGFSQMDTTHDKGTITIFDRISQGVKDFNVDTSAAPDDRITRKIIELRNLRGGFNINEAINSKIEEDNQKDEVAKSDLADLSDFFKSGNGNRWLANATIWIYRNHFTYNELKELVKFYKTSAGQKMATDFPVIMMKSLKAAEIIKDIYAAQKKINK